MYMYWKKHKINPFVNSIDLSMKKNDFLKIPW